MGVNLRGGFFLAQAVARHMLAAPAEDYRAMIFVTSVSLNLLSDGIRSAMNVKG